MRDDMKGFLFYLVMGFLSQYLLLFLWGVSAGPSSSAPYYSLLGSILVMIPCCILALFSIKAAALLSFIGGITMLALPISIAMGENRSLGEATVVSIVPVCVAAFSSWLLLKGRRKAMDQGAINLNFKKKIILAIIPLALEILAFNGSSVFEILLNGPQ